MILILYLLLSLSVIAQPENPGPLKAGWTNLTINRDGRTLNSILYYPSYVEGSGAQIDTTNGPYPLIAFGHGFAMQNSYYISLFKHLVSYGYVVIAPQFPDVNHLQLAFDLLFCVRYLKNQNTNPTSIFFRIIDTTKVGLSGHSMGGGASLLAAANDSSITVVAPLAAAETNPSAISVMNQIKSVVYLITAQNDGITPPQNHQIPMFNNALPIKGLPIIKGANHTKFMDTRIWDWTDPRGYLTPTEQLRLTRRYLTSVYNLFLKEDTTYFKFTFGSLIQNDTSIIFQRELKPLHPKKFSLLSPQNASILNQTSINFQWNKTYSLNLTDTIKYKLIISRDSLFNNIYFVKDSIMNPTYQHNFNEDGKYYWKVIAYSSDLTFTESNIFSFTILLAGNNDEDSFPTNFRLHQNYPNPFGKAIHSDNSTTTISFTLSEDGLTTLKIYDLLGREIQTLVNEKLEAGRIHRILFDGSGLASGVYFYRLDSKNKSMIKKFVFMK